MIAWLAQTLVGTAILMALVLALRGFASRMVGPRLGYLLWMVPAMRVLLPALPAKVATPLAGGAMNVLAMGRADGGGAGPAAGIDLVATMLTLWAIGAVAFLFYHVVAHWRFRRLLMVDATPVAAIGRVRVIASPVALGPLALGVVRPLVAMPMDWTERFDATERALALDHELAHHARGDILANWTALAMLALHWFDPIAWLAFRAFRADQELATDATVLARHGGAAVEPYARAMLAAAVGPTLSPTCHLNTVVNLKRRIAMLTFTPRSSRRIAMGAVLITGAGIAGVAATAATTQVAASSPAARTLIVETGDGDAQTLLVDGRRIAAADAARASLALPKDFDATRACSDVGRKSPITYVLKGEDGGQNYTVSCTGVWNQAGAVASRTSYRQALAALAVVRTSVEAQSGLPDAERRTIIASIDASVGDLSARR